MFIVEFIEHPGSWYLAPWNNGHGRALLKINAKTFDSRKAAEKAMIEAVKKEPERHLGGRGVVVKAES